MNAVTFNKAGFAALVGTTLPTLDKWVKQGLPVVRDGKAYKIDAPKAIAWMLERERDQSAAGVGGKGVNTETELRIQNLRAKLVINTAAAGMRLHALMPTKDADHILETVITMTQKAVCDLVPRRAATALVNRSEREIRAWLEGELSREFAEAGSNALRMLDEAKARRDAAPNFLDGEEFRKQRGEAMDAWRQHRNEYHATTTETPDEALARLRDALPGEDDLDDDEPAADE